MLGLNSEGQKDGTSATGNRDMVTVTLGQGQGGVTATATATAKALALGRTHTCVILNDNTVECWGRDNEGQTGTNGVPDLGQGRTAVALAAGSNHTCAILDNGSVRCWGDDSYNQTGGGTPISSGAKLFL